MGKVGRSECVWERVDVGGREGGGREGGGRREWPSE